MSKGCSVGWVRIVLMCACELRPFSQHPRTLAPSPLAPDPWPLDPWS